MKETFRNIGIAILATLLIIGGTYTAIRWDAIVAKWETNAEREVFKETTTYNEAGGVAPVLRRDGRPYDRMCVEGIGVHIRAEERSLQ